jgi:hypothetical protein
MSIRQAILEVRLEELQLIPAPRPQLQHGFTERHVENGDCQLCYIHKRKAELTRLIEALVALKGDKEMKDQMTPDLAVALGHKARELMIGMKDRVGRFPDEADFAGGFKMVLENHNVDTGQAASDANCIDKARKRGDEMFTLVGQDNSAPAVLCEWIKLNIETAPAGKLRNALERALKMRQRPGRKSAD